MEMPMTFLRPTIHATLIALLAAGCVTTHAADDARQADAHAVDASASDAPSPDALVLPDAFVCPDADGDGETDARCGGLDCDDTDAAISSTRTLCASAASVTRCAGGMRVDAACDVAAPYCDARTNGCVADACGDRVVHANEQCDASDGACRDCRRTCTDRSRCLVGEVCLPYYSDELGRDYISCVTANPAGAATGADCLTNEDCYSTLCDERSRRCTEAVWGAAGECAGPNRWPRFWPTPTNMIDELYGGVLWPGDLCEFECRRNADCFAGTQCVRGRLGSADYLLDVGVCRRAVSGPTVLGAACTRDWECETRLCAGGTCSLFCETDADCGAGAPHCLTTDGIDDWLRAEGWGEPLRACFP